MGKISAPLFNANPEQINVHLSRLFKRCADEYPGGMFEIRCIHPGTKAVKAQLFDTTPEGFNKGAAWAIDRNEGEGYNTYVGVNPRRPGTFPAAAASAEDVEIAFFQFADIDSEVVLPGKSRGTFDNVILSGGPYDPICTTTIHG